MVKKYLKTPKRLEQFEPNSVQGTDYKFVSTYQDHKENKTKIEDLSLIASSLNYVPKNMSQGRTLCRNLVSGPKKKS